MLHALDGAELSRLPAAVELGSDVPVRCLAHAAPERVAENRPLVGDGLALEDAVAGEGHGFFGESVSAPALCSCCSSAVAGGGDNLLRLISEVGGHLFVRGQEPLRRRASACGRGWSARRSAPPPGRCSQLFSSCSLICRERGLEASRYSCEYPLISGAPLLPDSISYPRLRSW